jgi:thiamine pyrophosphate-dependent acetolactate synthase large subunit-like protein
VGTPFGVGASLAAPDRQVVVLTGDGAFGFSAMELGTVARHRVPLLVVVANNDAWQIEVHDQRSRFGRVVGTRFAATDYAAMARAFGLHAERGRAACGVGARAAGFLRCSTSSSRRTRYPPTHAAVSPSFRISRRWRRGTMRSDAGAAGAD